MHSEECSDTNHELQRLHRRLLQACAHLHPFLSFFFFNDTATTEIYTLSLHDALPICSRPRADGTDSAPGRLRLDCGGCVLRSEEHTSELQSQSNLVCRLLLEKKKKQNQPNVQHATAVS